MATGVVAERSRRSRHGSKEISEHLSRIIAWRFWSVTRMRHEHMVSRTRLFLDLFACVLQEFVFTVLRTVELYSVCACFVRGRFS